jgi:hypothetical protein
MGPQRGRGPIQVGSTFMRALTGLFTIGSIEFLNDLLG